MVNLKLFGINEVEIVSTALFEYHSAMNKVGNISRSEKILEILSRIDESL